MTQMRDFFHEILLHLKFLRQNCYNFNENHFCKNHEILNKTKYHMNS